MEELTFKRIFELEWTFIKKSGRTVKYLVIGVKLPTGAVELITNTEDIATKVEYYINAYDDDFKLKTNPAVKIIDYMFLGAEE